MINSAARIAGYLVTWVCLILSLAFLGFQLYRHFGQSLELVRDAHLFPVVLRGILIYVIAVSCQAQAWGILLQGISSTGVKYLNAFVVYCRSSIAKYLPGNIFHFVGRHVLAKNFGWSQGPVGLSTFLEIVLLFVASGSLALAQVVVFIGHAGYIATTMVAITVPVLLLISILGLRTVWAKVGVRLWNRFPAIFGKHTENHIVLSAQRLYFSALLYLVFLLLCGVITWESGLAIVRYSDSVGADLISCVFAFGTAYLAGFVVPGAPGGLGVREAVLCGLLSLSIGAEASLAVVVIVRLITTLGDLASFVIGVLLPRMTAR